MAPGDIVVSVATSSLAVLNVMKPVFIPVIFVLLALFVLRNLINAAKPK